MSSHTKRIGEIGECAIVYNLMKIDGVGVSKSVGDNLPYDLIIAEGQKFVCYTFLKLKMRFYFRLLRRGTNRRL